MAKKFSSSSSKSNSPGKMASGKVHMTPHKGVVTGGKKCC